MPAYRPVHLDRFLRAVYRRYVAVRALERTGLGTLAGCSVALLLVPLLLWRGHPTPAPCVAVIATGAAAGLLWGLIRRPGVLGAAMEADRQLGLHDLLGTALVVSRGRASSNDPWVVSVLAAADHRCRGLSPSSVVLNRLGARAWGGIGLATALALTLALFTGSPADTRAAGPRAEGPDRPAATPPAPERPLLVIPASSQRPAAPGRDNDAAARAGQDVSEESTGQPNEPQPGEPAEPGEMTGDAAPQNSGSAPPGGEGDGGGSASTRPPESPRPHGEHTPPSSTHPQPPGPTGPSGTATGGAGRAADPSTESPPAGPAGTTSAGGTGERPASPWQTGRWPADIERAQESLDSGQVPPAYRELVREYFKQE